MSGLGIRWADGTTTLYAADGTVHTVPSEQAAGVTDVHIDTALRRVVPAYEGGAA